jgi:hypothetical protein
MILQHRSRWTSQLRCHSGPHKRVRHRQWHRLPTQHQHASRGLSTSPQAVLLLLPLDDHHQPSSRYLRSRKLQSSRALRNRQPNMSLSLFRKYQVHGLHLPLLTWPYPCPVLHQSASLQQQQTQKPYRPRFHFHRANRVLPMIQEKTRQAWCWLLKQQAPCVRLRQQMWKSSALAILGAWRH